MHQFQKLGQEGLALLQVIITAATATTQPALLPQGSCCQPLRTLQLHRSLMTCDLSHCWQKKGKDQKQKAIEVLGKAVAAFPTHPAAADVLYNRAGALKDLQRFEEVDYCCPL
jgi:hypothetical protein